MNPIPAQISKFKSLVNGYKISQVIMSAERLGVFAAMSAGLSDISDIAAQVSCHSERLAPLLNALVHYELLNKVGDQYSFAEDAAIINPSHPAAQNGYVRFSEDVRDKWVNLVDIARETTTGDLGRVTGKNLDETRNFISAMHANGVPQAKFISEKYDFSSRRIIDLGAGSGVYSLTAGERYATSSGVLVELPGVAEITHEYLNISNARERFSVLAGDYHVDLPDEQFDDVFMFAVAHQESCECLGTLLKRVKLSMLPGGRLFLTSFFLEESRTSPQFPALFSVEMLVMSGSGRVYTFGEIESALSGADFSFQKVDSIPGPATLYVAS